ncbi:hypothetical protein GGI25_003494 [Coemansia spiralis]|uniref:Smr domain-containing protein n=2 Tax=Coemansia TaxID=4863 RepID=A0A9W8G202_9FUNG|nr:hypothetical protein EDC05_003435 [Coemansia umbellata]KAJ2621534.1 hypothetical protein GGI26_003997 [Coemansia sp. RSA 1358]KAJ2676742.1 hypothetical protein GGI25_003494 [Coemansia spiralis]
MITLQFLISEYGQLVDKQLITAIWAEHSENQSKCRDIIHMLSGLPARQDATSVSLTNFSDSTSTGSLDPPFTATTDTSAATSATSTSGMHRSSARAAGKSDSIEAIESPEALTGFLVACFPECGVDYLKTKINEIFGTQDRFSFQVDPIEAIDMIGNAFYNDMEAMENQQYRRSRSRKNTDRSAAASSLSLADITAQYSVPGTGKRGKDKGRPRARGKGGRGTIAGTAAVSDGTLSQCSGNAWNAINAELDSICTVFPMLAISKVKSTYHECGANVDKTVERLASLVASQPELSSERDEALARSRLSSTPLSDTAKARRQSAQEKERVTGIVDSLRAIFPDEEESVLEAAALASQNADIAADQVLQIQSNTQDQAKGGMEQKNGKGKKGTRWRQALELASHRVVSSANTTTLPEDCAAHDPLKRIPLSELSSDARQWVAEHPTDPAYCRRRADALLEKRNELYTKAAKAYSRKTTLNGHGGTAMYYSMEGHRYDARARVWRMRAAQAAVAAMQHNDASIIDLHGLTRAEAVAVVLEETNAWYARKRDTDSTSAHAKPLHIVTGKGNHSTDGKAQLHPSVVRALRNNGWWFEEDNGYVSVLGVCQGGARSC